jgi:hypothetical protein
MASDVIPIDEWQTRRLVRPAFGARLLQARSLARLFRRRDRGRETPARRGGGECETVRVRNELKLWPKPGMMC